MVLSPFLVFAMFTEFLTTLVLVTMFLGGRRSVNDGVVQGNSRRSGIDEGIRKLDDRLWLMYEYQILLLLQFVFAQFLKAASFP